MATEKRLIDADALAMEIAKVKRCIQSKNSDYLTGYVSALSGVEGQIAYQPTVEVVHGRWENIRFITTGDGRAKVGDCSSCKSIERVRNYCPNCGAKIASLLVVIQIMQKN